ncbi:5833_t:CDS:2, partial [Dentiscutata erythropus]
MKFFKKLLKLFKKTPKQQDNWDDICEKVESWSTKSTNNEEKSYEIPTLLVDFESQFSVLELKFYTRYEEYVDNVRKEDTEKYKKFKMYFSFLNAHIRSYYNLFHNAIWYYSKAGAFDLLLWRRKQYEEDFEYTIGVLNKNFTHIYFLSYDDLLEYAENNLMSKKHSQMLDILGHTTTIYRLNCKAYNAEMQLGTLIFRLLAAVPELQKSKFFNTAISRLCCEEQLKHANERIPLCGLQYNLKKNKGKTNLLDKSLTEIWNIL